MNGDVLVITLRACTAIGVRTNWAGAVRNSVRCAAELARNMLCEKRWQRERRTLALCPRGWTSGGKGRTQLAVLVQHHLYTRTHTPFAMSLQKIQANGPYRALLLFHHIRMPKKIAAFHKWSEELELQGILKIGYPGLCLITDRTTRQSLVPEFIRRVKRLSWYTCELRHHGPIDPRAVPALSHALTACSTPTSVSRRSEIVQLERLKEVSTFLRAADAALPPKCEPVWAPFYQEAMRP